MESHQLIIANDRRQADGAFIQTLDLLGLLKVRLRLLSTVRECLQIVFSLRGVLLEILHQFIERFRRSRVRQKELSVRVNHLVHGGAHLLKGLAFVLSALMGSLLSALR